MYLLYSNFIAHDFIKSEITPAKVVFQAMKKAVFTKDLLMLSHYILAARELVKNNVKRKSVYSILKSGRPVHRE